MFAFLPAVYADYGDRRADAALTRLPVLRLAHALDARAILERGCALLLRAAPGMDLERAIDSATFAALALDDALLAACQARLAALLRAAGGTDAFSHALRVAELCGPAVTAGVMAALSFGEEVPPGRIELESVVSEAQAAADARFGPGGLVQPFYIDGDDIVSGELKKFFKIGDVAGHLEIADERGSRDGPREGRRFLAWSVVFAGMPMPPAGSVAGFTVGIVNRRRRERPLFRSIRSAPGRVEAEASFMPWNDFLETERGWFTSPGQLRENQVLLYARFDGWEEAPAAAPVP